MDGIEALATASRTSAPRVAKDLLTLLHIETDNGLVPSLHLFDHLAWGVGTKIKHFKEIQRATGVDFKDMLFFDDEYRNIDVQDKLGVTFVHLSMEDGLTWEAYENGLETWRKKHGHM